MVKSVHCRAHGGGVALYVRNQLSRAYVVPWLEEGPGMEAG